MKSGNEHTSGNAHVRSKTRSLGALEIGNLRARLMERRASGGPGSGWFASVLARRQGLRSWPGVEVGVALGAEWWLGRRGTGWDRRWRAAGTASSSKRRKATWDLPGGLLTRWSYFQFARWASPGGDADRRRNPSYRDPEASRIPRTSAADRQRGLPSPNYGGCGWTWRGVLGGERLVGCFYARGSEKILCRGIFFELRDFERRGAGRWRGELRVGQVSITSPARVSNRDFSFLRSADSRGRKFAVAEWQSDAKSRL